MARAIVFNKGLSQDDRRRVEALVRAAGFEPVIGAAPPVDAIDLDADVGIVCLPLGADDEEHVLRSAEEYAAAGARVIAIWLDERAEEALPAVVQKFGSAAIAVNSENAQDALEGEAVWEAPGGKKRQAPDMRRNRC